MKCHVLIGLIKEDVYLVHVFSDNVASVWNELKEYDRIVGEFDILTKLLDCTCAARAELNDHGKLLQLMQFLMGLNDFYQHIRSNLLTREILSEVKDAFVIISKEESYRGIPSSSVKTEKPQVFAFVYRPNDNKEGKTLIGTIFLCANLKINGVNYHFGWIFDSGADQYMTNSSKNMFDLVNISKLNLTVGYLNWTLAKNTHVENLKLNENEDLKQTVLGTGSESAGLYLFDSQFNNFVISQNEIAKRKRRHLLNVARVLNGKSPFSLVYVKEPNLSHLRSFGCLCFAAMVKGSDKFSHRPNDDEKGTPGRDDRVHQPDVGAITDHVGHDEELSTTLIVHCLSQHMRALLKSHFDIALKVLKHLKLAPRLGVEFSKSKSDCVITAFSDSDLAKCPMTKRSVSGYCVFINGNLVSWKSRRHATLSKSSA
nr:ribonuclease H-like domain-containing protein [Tanacetum cinerariifolium]